LRLNLHSEEFGLLSSEHGEVLARPATSMGILLKVLTPWLICIFPLHAIVTNVEAIKVAPYLDNIAAVLEFAVLPWLKLLL